MDGILALRRELVGAREKKKYKSFLINPNLVVDGRDGCSTSAQEGFDSGGGRVEPRRRAKLRNTGGMPAQFDP